MCTKLTLRTATQHRFSWAFAIKNLNYFRWLIGAAPQKKCNTNFKWVICVLWYQKYFVKFNELCVRFQHTNTQTEKNWNKLFGFSWIFLINLFSAIYPHWFRMFVCSLSIEYCSQHTYNNNSSNNYWTTLQCVLCGIWMFRSSCAI